MGSKCYIYGAGIANTNYICAIPPFISEFVSVSVNVEQEFLWRMAVKQFLDAVNAQNMTTDDFAYAFSYTHKKINNKIQNNEEK